MPSRRRASAPSSKSGRRRGPRVEPGLQRHQAARAALSPMSHDRYTDAYIAGILGSAEVIAMVGASATTNRPSYFAMKYLLGKGYRVIPVNPKLAGQQILGQPVFAELALIPSPVDV